MSTGILSDQSLMQFGSIDYNDPKIIAALGGGLKGRSTTLWGQIVTALKMVWLVLWLPYTVPKWCCVKIIAGVFRFYNWVLSLIRKICKVVNRFYIRILDVLMVVNICVNRRMRVLLCASGIGLVYCFGLGGLCAFFLFLGAVIACYVPTDLQFYVTFTREIGEAWEDNETDDIPDIPQRPGKTLRRRLAVKLASRAISKVGLLSATRANSLVYQKVIIDEMDNMKVRYCDRVNILPEAIIACLHRSEDVQRVERCLEHLVQPTVSL
nr:MAG: hypothetical protein [Tombusviridae sp.]